MSNATERQHSANRHRAQDAGVEPCAWPAVGPAKGTRRCHCPGGCAIGARPMDIHTDVLAADWALKSTARRVSCMPRREAGGLERWRLSTFRLPLCGAHGKHLMARRWRKGTTVYYNAAREPELGGTCDCLRAMGAQLTATAQAGSRFSGVGRVLHGATHRVVDRPDQNWALLLAPRCAVGSRTALAGAINAAIGAFCEKLDAAGIDCDRDRTRGSRSRGAMV